MEHRRFLQSLNKEQRRSLTERNNASAFIRLTVLCACFLVSSAAIVQGWALLPVWLLVHGLLLVSLFHLLHECVHDTVFVQRLPNRVLSHMCGFILFLPAIWFRHFHHAHHRHTNLPAKDPELESDKPRTLNQWLVHVSGFSVWRSQCSLLFRALYNPASDAYVQQKDVKKARLEMLLMLGAYFVLFVISAANASTFLLMVWIIPLLIGQPFLRLYLLAEHADCEHSSDMLRNTRTVLTNPIMRWFTWNMPFHTEHHVYPTVPFHRLPVLHRLMEEYLVEVDTSYTEFNKRFVGKLAKA